MGTRITQIGIGVALGCTVVVLLSVTLWKRLFATSDKVGSSIVGRVADPEGMPIDRPRVCAAYFTSMRTPVPTCVDGDAQGRYAVGGLAAGRYLVTASHSGFVAGSAKAGDLIDVVEGTRRVTVDVVLQRGGARVTGLVIDATGKPVPRASVRAEPNAAIVEVRADDLGRFSLSLPSGSLLLSARAEAYAATYWMGSAPSADVRLRLRPGAVVQGVVASSVDGRPMPDIEVRALSAKFSPLSSFSLRSMSRADGAFEIRGLEPGSYTLVASGEGSYGELAQPIKLGLGAAVENVRLLTNAAAKIEGRVVLSSTEQPCRRGAVKLGPADPGEPPAPEEAPWTFRSTGVRSFRANVETDGTVRFGAVPPGHYYVGVQCEDEVLREGPRILDVGTTSLSKLTWKMVQASILTISTVDDRDRPLPWTDFLLDLPKWGDDRRPTVTMPGRTDANGRYVFKSLYPGIYRLSPSPPAEAMPVVVHLGEEDGLASGTLKFVDATSISATVRTRGGDPADEVSVTGIRRYDPTAGGPLALNAPVGMNLFMAAMLGGGLYRIGPLKPGRYEVRVDDGVNPPVRTWSVLRSGETASITIEIERSGKIEGRVVDADGAPMAGVWVDARADSASQPPFPANPFGGDSRVLTDSKGRFLLDRLSGGDTEYAVRAEKPGGTAMVRRGVKAGDLDVIVTLQPAATVAGTVDADCGGAPTPFVVQATSAETGQTHTEQMSTPGGPFRLSVAPGHVELTAFCSGGAGMTRTEMELRPGEELAELHVVLQAPTLTQVNDPR
jgi:hypothetical protein